MKEIPFFVCDSFTETPFQGNPAGVFLDDQGSLTTDEMRRLAGEVHLESAFVLPADLETADAADLRLRYFTGVCEVPLCGHATIAALTVLREQGRLSPGKPQRAATLAGILEVGVTESGAAVLRQRSPEFGEPLGAADVQRVAEALGCDQAGAVHPNLPVQRVSTGTPWLLVPVHTRSIVDQTPTRFDAISALSERHGTFGMYVFVPDNERVWSRCYAPIAGLNEDPVTGSASGALGGYLAQHGVLPLTPGAESAFVNEQGFAGGRGGRVTVRVHRTESGEIAPVTIEGVAAILASGSFRLS